MPRTSSSKPTLSSLISETSRKLVWLKRVKRLAGGFVNKNFELSEASLNPPAKDAEQAITFVYVGEKTQEAYDKAVRALENNNDVRFRGSKVAFVGDKFKVVIESEFMTTDTVHDKQIDTDDKPTPKRRRVAV